MHTSTTVFDAFQYPGIGPVAFKSFLLPDLLVVVLLSVLRAYKQLPQLEHVILGGFAFGTLYCINASWLTGGGLLPTTMMVLGCCFNLFLVFSTYSFRTATGNDFKRNALKTLVQTIGIWTIALALLPYLIMSTFDNDMVPEQPHLTLAILLFLMMGTLGLASAYVMVEKGEGRRDPTPTGPN